MYGESTSRRIPHRIQEKFFLTGAHETHSKFAAENASKFVWREHFQIPEHMKRRGGPAVDLVAAADANKTAVWGGTDCSA